MEKNKSEIMDLLDGDRFRVVEEIWEDVGENECGSKVRVRTINKKLTIEWRIKILTGQID